MEPCYRLLECVPGMEGAKRALDVAIAGKHSVLLIGYGGARALAEAAMKLVAPQGEDALALRVMAWPWCLCGGFGHPRMECRCTVRMIQAHIRTRPTADIVVDCPDPTLRDMADRRNPQAPLREWNEELLGFLEQADRHINLGYDGILAVARVAESIRKLSGESTLHLEHVSEAIQYAPRFNKAK